MRAVFVVILACCVGGCMTAGGGPSTTTVTAAPSAGDWKIDRKLDPVTGVGIGAWVASSRVTSRTRVFPRPAFVQLLCFKNEPLVRLKFDERIGSNRSASLAYRIDENPGREPAVRFLSDYKTVVIEDRKDVAAFAKDVATASEFRVSITSLTVGKTSATFPVRGAPAAIEAAFAECPIGKGP